MPASQGGGPEWDRLGKMLEQRRAELNPRWRDLTVFAEERGLNWRLAWDIEKNRRTSYRSVTLTAIEVSYGWQPGSIARVLEGGEPVLAGSPLTRAEVLARITARWGGLDGAPGFINTLWNAEGPESVMLGAITGYLDRTAEQDNNGRHLREA
jgi:hypothetical protein